MSAFFGCHKALSVLISALSLFALLATPARSEITRDTSAAEVETIHSQDLRTIANVHLAMGSELEKGKEYFRALNHYKQALELAPRDIQIRYRLAGVYDAIGDETSSIVHYTLAIETNPEFVDARVNRAKVCIRVGYNAQALTDLNIALKINPRSAEARYQRGILLIKLQRVREAYNDLLQAHQINPRYPRPTLNGDIAYKAVRV